MPNILVIEPDAEICHAIATVLSTEFDAVMTAAEAESGFRKAQDIVPAIVICSGQLSGRSDGVALCQRFKSLPHLSSTLFFLTLPHQPAEARLQALEMGVDDVLSLPLDVVEIKARVRAGLRLWHMTQDLYEQKHLLDLELAEAEAYVRSLLPADITEKVPIHARFIPSRMLGGDCYDYYWLDPDYLAVYLLDVSGHGLGSALLSTSVLNVLRSQSLPDVNFYRPEKVLKALNETFQMNDQNEKYFTIWYGVYNRVNRQLLYASAGHPPAILVSGEASHVERLRTSGLPIGMLPEASYQWQRCHVPHNSRLYLFSDGVYEIQQTDNTMMTLEDFIEILAGQRIERTIDDILSTVSQRTQNNSFSDDLSLLEIQLD